MQSPVTPLFVLSHAQIILHYRLEDDPETFMALLAALAGKEKRLLKGGNDYLVQDIEVAMQALRKHY